MYLPARADCPPNSAEVSWQSASWALIPLALNSMTQPAGRLLQYPPQVRTYLRASPILCAFDALSALVRLLVYLWRGFSPSEAVARIRHVRTENMHDNSNGTGIQALERLPSIRLLLFLFGTLPQAIKLMALDGVPWTKAWGGMFLVSFVILECLVLVGNRIKTYESVHLGRPRFNQSLHKDVDFHDKSSIFMNCLRLSGFQTLNRSLDAEYLKQRVLQSLEDRLDNFDESLRFWGLVTDLALQGWMVKNLVWPESHAPQASPLLVFTWSFVQPFGVYIVVMSAAFIMPLISGWKHESAIARTYVEAGAMAWFIGWAYMYNTYEEVLIYGIWLLWARIVLEIHQRSESLTKKIRCPFCGGWHIYHEMPDFDQEKIWPIFEFLCFGSMTALTFVYYAMRYDPSGTHKPEWTNSLG